MKLLVISNSEWRDDNSFGSTFTNFFDGIDNFEIANIFCREGTPSTKVCDKFLKITDKNLFKALLHKIADPAICVNNDRSLKHNADNKTLSFIKRKRWSIFYILREFLWEISKYKRDNFYHFIESFSPDAILLPTYSFGYINKMALYLKNKYNIPIISYMSDDEYSLRRVSFSPIFWLNRLYQRKWVIRSLKNSDKVFVISEVQKNELFNDLNIKAEILTKSLNFETDMPKLKKPSNHIKLIYTGNLGDNRWESIAKLGSIIDEINNEITDKKISIDIYTGTLLNNKIKSTFKSIKSINFKGFVSSDKLADLWNSADYLIHSESLRKTDSYIVHQSFSTKLVDYMHSGRCIIAIGEKNLASIQHLDKNECALVLTEFLTAKSKLLNLFSNDNTYVKYIENAWKCGLKYHNKSTVLNMLKKTLNQLRK